MDRDDARRLGRERLLGDRIESVLKAVGAYRAAKAIERRTGGACGCAKRTAALNAWDARRRSKD